VKFSKLLWCLAGALALVAIAAPAAGASTLTAESYPAVLHGGEAGETLTLNHYECNGPPISGALAAASSSVTMTPGAATCNYIFGEGELNPGSCTFTYHFGSDAGHFGRYSGTMDIGPSGCGPITLTNYTGCKTAVGAQSGLPVSYEQVGATIRITAEVSSLTYTQTGGGACAPTGTFTNGTLTGSWIVHAGSKALTIVDNHTPMFEAETYPATVAGEQNSEQHQVMKFGSQSVNCSAITYSGSLASAATTVSLSPAYSGCTMFGFAEAGSTKTNGCSIVLHAGVALGGGKYRGTQDISCPGGSSIEFIAPISKCKVSVPSQEGLSAVEYEVITKSGKKAIKAATGLSGIKYTTVDGFLCPLAGEGSFSDGSESGSMFLQGKTGSGTLQGLRIGG
jgi:heat shock protein HslJ